MVVCTLLLASTLVAAVSVTVETQNTLALETQLFSYSISVPPKRTASPHPYLTGDTYVRITFNASQPISFFCQNSWEYTISNSTGWHNVSAHWNTTTAFLNTTYTIPTTDTWWFTLVNYDQTQEIDVYNIALYRIDTYSIHIESNKANYSMGEEATVTVNIMKNGAPLQGQDTTLQVSSPNGTILSQTNQTDEQGQVKTTLALPHQYGQYNATVQTTIQGKTIEDSATFTVSEDTTPPSTTDDYDQKWYTQNFAIILTAADNESGVAETYYKVNNGTTQKVSTDGHPQITAEGANNTLEYWSVDNAGNEEKPHKILTGIKLDKTPPTGLIMINGNTSYTNSTLTTLTILANDTISGIAQMRLSNDNLTWTAYETCSTPKSWTLELGEGPKKVYVQFKNNAGLASTAYPATVILDMTPPTIANVSRTPDSNVQSNQPVIISVNATDTTTGIESVRLAYNTNSSSNWIDLPMILNQTTHLFESTISGQQTDTLVTYRITAYDNAGNQMTENNDRSYIVVPEFQTLTILVLASAITTLIAAVRKKRTIASISSAQSTSKLDRENPQLTGFLHEKPQDYPLKKRALNLNC